MLFFFFKLFQVGMFIYFPKPDLYQRYHYDFKLNIPYLGMLKNSLIHHQLEKIENKTFDRIVLFCFALLAIRKIVLTNKTELNAIFSKKGYNNVFRTFLLLLLLNTTVFNQSEFGMLHFQQNIFFFILSIYRYPSVLQKTEIIRLKEELETSSQTRLRPLWNHSATWW